MLRKRQMTGVLNAPCGHLAVLNMSRHRGEVWGRHRVGGRDEGPVLFTC